MPVFNDTRELYDTLGVFLNQLMNDPEVGPKFAAANTSFEVLYSEPEGNILIDCRSNPPVVTCGGDNPGEIRLRMAADDGHKFWMGSLNVNLALVGGKVKIEGPVSKIMKLLPAVRPAFPRYRQFLADRPGADLSPEG